MALLRFTSGTRETFESNKTEEHSRESVFHIETVTFLCRGYYYNRRVSLVSSDITISLSLTLLQFPIQHRTRVCRTVYVRTWTSAPPAWLVIRAIPSELASKTHRKLAPLLLLFLSPCNRFVASFPPRWEEEEEEEDCFRSREKLAGKQEVLRMVILWLMIINMGRSYDYVQSRFI